MVPHERDRLCYFLDHDEAPAGGTVPVRYVIGGKNPGAMDEGEAHDTADCSEGSIDTFDGCQCIGFEV